MIIIAIGVDLQPTYTDAWVSAVSDKLGMKTKQFALTLWIMETELQEAGADKEDRAIVPIRIINSGVQSIGSDTRNWRLILNCKSRSELRLLELNPQSSNLKVEKIGNPDLNSLILEFGLLYPGESVDIRIEIEASNKDSLCEIIAKTNLPIQPSITIRSYHPNLGPITKFGNIVFLSAMVVLGLIYFYLGLIEYLDLYRPDYFGAPLEMGWGGWLSMPFVCVGILGLITIHAVAFTKIVLLIHWLF